MRQQVIPFYSKYIMAEPIQDSYESYPIKENYWNKNNVSHTISRAKKTKGRDYCSYCRHHHCYDPTRVHGNKSLKKSKVVSYKTTKYADKLVVMPEFVSIRNGETHFEDNNL